MGYMTTITILNDDWHEMEKNPKEMVENIWLFNYEGGLTT